jgi:hypothetical protein
LASKIKEEMPIEDKVSLAKEKYKTTLSSLNYQMESKLENEKNPVAIKNIIRNTIEKAFESNV